MGAKNAGKSCLMLRYMKDIFCEDKIELSQQYDIILPIKSDKHSILLKEKKNNEAYKEIDNAEPRRPSGVLICFDVMDPQSYEEAKQHVQDCQRYCPETATLFLVGCKTDLRTTPSEGVSLEIATEYAKKNALTYIETSAKDATQVQKVFQNMFQEISKRLPVTESLFQLKSTVQLKFNTYVTSISNSPSGIFLAYTQSKREYALQEKFRDIYDQYFNPNNKCFTSFTEEDFIRETLRIIEKANKHHKIDNQFYANFTPNRLSSALSDLLNTLTKESSTLAGYQTKYDPPPIARNYQTLG